MVNSIKLIQTSRIKSYRPILEGLIDDFGYSYYHAILAWCNVMDISKTEEEVEFWEVFLVKKGRKTIGICGLYSLNKKTEELWLGWFGILPEYRNSGVGVIVLKELEEKAKIVGCKILYSYVDKNGKPLSFYYRNGFELISTVNEYTKTNNISMEKFENPEDYVIRKVL